MCRGVPRSPLNRRGNLDTVNVPSATPGDTERSADQSARHVRCVGPVCGIIEITRRGGGMADAAVLKTVGGNPVRVRVPSPAPAAQCEKRPLYPSRYGGCCVGAAAMGACVPPELLGQASNCSIAHFPGRTTINGGGTAVGDAGQAAGRRTATPNSLRIGCCHNSNSHVSPIKS